MTRSLKKCEDKNLRNSECSLPSDKVVTDTEHILLSTNSISWMMSALCMKALYCAFILKNTKSCPGSRFLVSICVKGMVQASDYHFWDSQNENLIFVYENVDWGWREMTRKSEMTMMMETDDWWLFWLPLFVSRITVTNTKQQNVTSYSLSVLTRGLIHDITSLTLGTVLGQDSGKSLRSLNSQILFPNYRLYYFVLDDPQMFTTHARLAFEFFMIKPFLGFTPQLFEY